MSAATDVSRWLDEQLARGCTPESLVEAMVLAGHARKAARKTVAAALPADVAAAFRAGTGANDTGADESDAALAAAARAPNALPTPDRDVHVLFACASPRIVLFGNLLDASECDALIEASRDKIQPALVVDRASGEFKTDASRTSEGTHFAHAETPLVARIEQRVEALLGFPSAQQEPLQILHYGIGGEYEPHFDYFDPADAGSKTALGRGGQRVATLIMYLNDVDAGGATVFPRIGLESKPRRGNAVYFESVDDDGKLDPRTLHGGAPVGAGEKWIATKWIRERNWL